MFFGTKEPSEMMERPNVPVVQCTPAVSPVVLNAETFKGRYGLEPMKVRRNVDSLTTAEFNAIKVGILKMRALPYTDPTSWEYQVSIHGTYRTENLTSWNTCHRSGEGIYFLAWHRMYCYFFERILRAKSGRANLTLPYWNYQLNPVLHPAYRDKSPGNPLYEATRSIPINTGGALPASIMTAINNSMALVPYYTFQSNFNGGPHGSVHISVGGPMGVVTTAAKDPVFWLHHSNVDRLWEEWRSMCGGRANPTDTSWLNKTYTFFDETGTPINIKGSDVLLIAGQLNYRYDDRPPVVNCGTARPATVTRELLLNKPSAITISGRLQRTELADAPAAAIDQFVRTKNRTTFNFTDRNNPERLVLLFEGINVNRFPEGVVEVYLNLPAGQTPTAESNYFAGLLDLFSAQHHATRHTAEQQANEDIEVDVTKAAQALGLTIQQLRNAQISFYVRGVSVNGIENLTQADITVRHIKVAVDKYRLN